ncbi:PREDICTED: basic 7S globulin-like [Tarenaya hassleriana]|uniref:basic 7S globulin-like n=1 Tax=Tarenaya hassleriana TaxID=28532 RepID=UPI00053C34D8|nr:PREDICTED: basic 7S globulin-like [Tarenaya hassleriana]
MATLRLVIIIFSAATVFFQGPSMAALKEPNKPHAFILPVAKNMNSGLYSVAIGFGTKPTVSTEFALDLGGRFPWYECFTPGYNSSSYRPIRYGSPKCKLAEDTSPLDCAVGVPVSPGCSNHSCQVASYNPSYSVGCGGGLAQDVMSFISTPDGSGLGSRFDSPPLIFACCSFDLIPSSDSSLGMLGLSRHVLSLPMQLSSAFKIPRKFALCLPSKPKGSGYGDLFIGGGPYSLPPLSGDASHLFASTPLLVNPVNERYKGVPSYEYFIGVKSIKIEGEAVPLKKSLLSIRKDGSGGTKLSMASPFTYFHPSIFEPFYEAFMAKATEKKMVQVWADDTTYITCFDKKSIRRRGTNGPDDVPEIELVLQSGGIWRIHGSDYMVDLDERKTCLQLFDGGPDAVAGIVIGTRLLEDNLIEIDLESSKFSVTSSLLVHNTSCSRFRTA